MYCDEHQWLWTQDGLREFLSGYFGSVEFEEWIPGHVVVVMWGRIADAAYEV